VRRSSQQPSASSAWKLPSCVPMRTICRVARMRQQARLEAAVALPADCVSQPSRSAPLPASRVRPLRCACACARARHAPCAWCRRLLPRSCARCCGWSAKRTTRQRRGRPGDRSACGGGTCEGRLGGQVSSRAMR
jgi:hypothetical protein